MNRATHCCPDIDAAFAAILKLREAVHSADPESRTFAMAFFKEYGRTAVTMAADVEKHGAGGNHV